MGECIAEDKCQTDKDFCTTGMDPNCSKSPYQEPEATLNGLGIGLIVACSAVFLATLFFFHKRAKGRVEKRFKKHFATKVIESMSVDTWNDDLDLQNFGDAFRKIDSTGSGKWQGRRIYLKRRIDGVLRCFQPWKDFREGHLMLIPAATSALTRRRNDNTCLIILYFFNRVNEAKLRSPDCKLGGRSEWSEPLIVRARECARKGKTVFQISAFWHKYGP
jgi:hypothetical protein